MILIHIFKDRDIYRTNPNHPSFDNEDNILLLKEILISYAHYNFDIGYVQGMNNLLSEIMIIMNMSSFESFWCFVFLMESIESRFSKDQTLMFSYFDELNRLLESFDPELLLVMKEINMDNMLFTFQWLLLDFQREFKRPQLYRIWEILWTKKHGSKFNLFIALAIIIEIRDLFFKCDDSSIINVCILIPGKSYLRN